MKIFFALFTISIITFSSCNVMHCPTKEAFIRSYSEFVDEAETKRMNDHADWRDEDVEFKDYADRCYQEFKATLTMEEKKVFWSKTLKYYYNRYEGDLSKAYDDAKLNLSTDFNKDIKEMLQNADGDVLKMVKDIFRQDLKKGLDSVMDVLNELGDNLKKELEEE